MPDLKKLDEIVDQLDIESKKLKAFHEIYAEIEKLKVDLEANVNAFESGSKKLDEASNSLINKTQDLTSKITEIQSAIMLRVDSIEQSNKKFQKEFESSNVSRLERFKSDIEVTIRNEGGQTAKNIENGLINTFIEKLTPLVKGVEQLKFLYVLVFAILAANLYLINKLIN